MNKIEEKIIRTVKLKEFYENLESEIEWRTEDLESKLNQLEEESSEEAHTNRYTQQVIEDQKNKIEVYEKIKQDLLKIL